MEDNNLWLRHLLNLVVQVVLALYVFWRSVIRRNGVGLLVSGVLVFVAGIIKYGERTWSLKCSSLKGLESLSGNRTQASGGRIVVDASGGYSRTVSEALGSISSVVTIFSGSSYFVSVFYTRQDINEMVKLGRLQLGLMYDELYTKALVLRTRIFIIFRHISQISLVVAFALFHAIVDKKNYAKADIAITYALFMGGFFLEVRSMLNSMMSPWTWLMLKDRKWERLAKLSLFLFSSGIGWPEKKQRWPSSIGQYNFLRWWSSSTSSEGWPARTTFSQRVMNVVRRVFVDLIGSNKGKIFWMSKVLDTWYVDADEMTMECVAKEIILLDDELKGTSPPREWPNLSSLLKRIQYKLTREYRYIRKLDHDFGYTVVHIHMLTELHLSKYPSDKATSDDGMVRVCRKLSNYMMYLLVAHPSMLPLTTSSVLLLEKFQIDSDLVRQITREMDEIDLQPNEETVEEMVYMWARLLIYAAGKSRREMHPAQLTSIGGELITFVWLVMSFYKLGDSYSQRIRIVNTDYEVSPKDIYAFNIIARTVLLTS